MRKEKDSSARTHPALSPESAGTIYASLLRCRKFDDKVVELYPEREMRCPAHLSIGQEGAAAGVCGALAARDQVWSTHRCHSHVVAKGGDMKSLMAELYGKAAGCSRGKGGSMHFLDPAAGAMGSSAIVGGTIPLAVGAALSAKLLKKNIVSVAFFGDGGIEQGSFHESLNFASLKKLPVLFVCENNRLATCTWLADRQPYEDLYLRAEGYRIPAVQVDGTRVEEVFFAARKAVDRIRKGDGPYFIEIQCYRWKEHVGPNFDTDLGYRTQEELDRWIRKDPVVLFGRYLVKHRILSEAALSEIASGVDAEVAAAAAFAKSSPFPEPAELLEDV